MAMSTCKAVMMMMAKVQIPKMYSELCAKVEVRRAIAYPELRAWVCLTLFPLSRRAGCSFSIVLLIVLKLFLLLLPPLSLSLSHYNIHKVQSRLQSCFKSYTANIIRCALLCGY